MGSGSCDRRNISLRDTSCSPQKLRFERTHNGLFYKQACAPSLLATRDRDLYQTPNYHTLAAMDFITSVSNHGIAGILAKMVAVFLGYRLLLILYNISPLHPLSPIPGPKLAAASYLPEFYYDVICVGKYTTKIREMHEKYGRSKKHITLFSRANTRQGPLFA